MPPASDPAFEDLLVALLAANETGGTVAIEAILAEHPEQQQALRAALSRLARAGILEPPPNSLRYPDKIGDFRLLQRIGEGGMGLVFLAEQESTQRKVAIKLVRPELLRSTVARERFHREVETIARVKHPGIVPVIAVGEDAGIPYFAMQYVAGCSLAEVLMSVAGRRPAELFGVDFARAIGAPLDPGQKSPWPGTWWQATVGVLATVADAVAHVHARGILHRDLKPSNIMVTARGDALLLDFGLAHVSVDDKLTQTGAEIGSLAYMSPEQVRSEALDERTDVYSLGVTLYQLLALAPPFAAENDAALRTAILQGASHPLRERNPELPPELRVVVETAMDLDRIRRYPSVAAMQADLEAVLARRPIAARRLGSGVRIARWRSRHPFAAGATAVTLALLFVLPLFVVWVQHEQHLGLQRARDVAEADLQQARGAIDLMWRHTDELAELRDPAANELRIRMLDESVAFYEQLRAQHPNDARIRRTLADVYRTKGLVGWQTGQLDYADENLATAATLFGSDPEPNHEDPLLGAAAVAKLQARVAMERERWADADAAIERMIAPLHVLISLAPHNVDARLQLADALNIQSHVRGHQGRRDEKLALLHESLAAKRALLQVSDDERIRASMAMQCMNLADTLSELSGEAAAAIDGYRETLGLLESLSLKRRDTTDMRCLLAEAHCGLGGVLLQRGELDEAAVNLTAAIAIQRELCRQNPTRPQAHYELARVYCTEARLLLEKNLPGAAAQAAEEAIRATTQGLALMPENKAMAALRRRCEEVLAQAQSLRTAAPADASANRDR